MFVIENEAHEQVGKVLNNLRTLQRPDGGWTNNAKVDEQVHDENGDVFFIREVTNVTEGEGPRVISHAAPTWDGEKWAKVKTVGEALPPAPDPVPGDDDYNYVELRKRDYPTVGDQLDAIWKELTPVVDGEADVMKKKIEAVKVKHPKPEVIEEEPVA